MKRILVFSLGLASLISYAQNSGTGRVGINTTEMDLPRATLDIRPNANNAQESADTNEGLLIPKLSKKRLAKINNNYLKEGTMVYVNEINTPEQPNEKVANVFSVGHYIYENGTWNPIKTKKPKASLLNKEFVCSADNLGQELQSSDGVFTCVYNEGFEMYGWKYEGVVYVRGGGNEQLQNGDTNEGAFVSLSVPMSTKDLETLYGISDFIYYTKIEQDADISIINNYTSAIPLSREVIIVYTTAVCYGTDTYRMRVLKLSQPADAGSLDCDLGEVKYLGYFTFEAPVRILEE